MPMHFSLLRAVA